MFSCFLLYIVLPFLLAYIFFRPDPLPLCGVYARPGKFFLLKYAVFRLMYYLRKRRQAHTTDGAGYGVKSKSDVALMERKQELPSGQPFAVDAVYFNAANKDGQYFVAAISRRPGKVAQTVLMLRAPEVGLLELVSMPDTRVPEEPTDDEKMYAAAGLSISCVEPMKKWCIRFKGGLRVDRSDQYVDANIIFSWTACTDYFDFDTDMDAHALANAIAREPWSRVLFRRLRDAHQTHHEQFGDFRGRLEWTDSQNKLRVLDLQMRGARDHSYGNVRLWSHFHRYAMQFVHLEDGTCFNAAVVSIPQVTMSRLEFGYAFTKDGRKLALRSVRLPLHSLGETGLPPTEYEFTFEDENGKVYHVECEVLHRPEFFMGDEEGRRDTTIYEQLCRYKVNGVDGYGVSEWLYRYAEATG